MSRVRALIVGCGNIAGRFDTAKEDSVESPLTHAGAYSRDGRFEIAGCVEPDDDRRQAFMKDWGIALGFRSIDEVRESAMKFDVISICTPTQCHAHDLQVSLLLKPKLIFCEKPVTNSAMQTERLVREFLESKIPLAVNYTRRWDQSVSELRDGIQQGRWGRLRSVVGYYNKGLLNNGSHMLDLLHLLLGPLSIVKIGKPVDDYSPQDLSIPVWLEAIDGLPVMLACGHAADFALFELQLVFANAIISMEEGGLFWRERSAAASSTFAGYRVLDEGVRRAGEYSRAMLGSINNIFGAISHGQALASTGETALATQCLCEQIRQS